jgi:hypothetical protein
MTTVGAVLGALVSLFLICIFLVFLAPVLLTFSIWGYVIFIVFLVVLAVAVVIGIFRD